MSLTAILLILCGLLACVAAVLVLSALALGSRAGRLEESGDWWPDYEEE